MLRHPVWPDNGLGAAFPIAAGGPAGGARAGAAQRVGIIETIK